MSVKGLIKATLSDKTIESHAINLLHTIEVSFISYVYLHLLVCAVLDNSTTPHADTEESQGFVREEDAS